MLRSSLPILASSLASLACLGDLLDLLHCPPLMLLLFEGGAKAVVVLVAVLVVTGDVVVLSPSATTTIPSLVAVFEEQTPSTFLLPSSLVT